MRTTKKAAPKQAVKQLEYYGMYRLTRTATTVKFGCGAVILKKSDLRAMSALVLDKPALETFKNLNLDNYRSGKAFVINDIKGKIDTQAIRAIGAAMINYPVYFAAVSRIKGACGSRQTIAQMLNIPAKTYQGIIGN